MNEVSRPKVGEPGYGVIDRSEVVSKEGATLKVTRIFLTAKGERMLTSNSTGIKYGVQKSQREDFSDSVAFAGS